MSDLILNKLDYLRIRKAIDSAKAVGSINPAEAQSLLNELENAIVVEPKEVPSDIVTMNSIVKIRFLNTNKHLEFQIVYPKDANLKENKISIFSPVATALIGYKTNDEVEWIVPAGVTRIRIEEIVYQPEASGDFNL